MRAPTDTDLDQRAVPRHVTDEQIAEYRGEFFAAGLMLAVFLVAALIGGNIPGALLLGGFLAVMVIARMRRIRDPIPHLTAITGPIAAEILRAGHLTPRPGEDPAALRIRLVDTMDLLRPRGRFGGWSRRLAFALTFVAGLKAAGLLGSVEWSTVMVGVVTGLAVGVGTTEWPRHRRALEAVRLLEAQLDDLKSLPTGAADEVER